MNRHLNVIETDGGLSSPRRLHLALLLVFQPLTSITIAPPATFVLPIPSHRFRRRAGEDALDLSACLAATKA